MPPPLDSAFRKDVAPAAPVQWLQQVSKLLLYCPCVGVDLSIRMATRVSDRCKSPGAPKHLSRRLWPSQPQAYQLRGTHVSGNNTKEAQRGDYHRAQGPPGRVKGSSDSRPLGIRLLCKAPGRRNTYHKGSGHASHKHQRYLRRMSPNTNRDVWVVAKAVRNNQCIWVSYNVQKPPGARADITRLGPCRPQASPL
jgi:hypothetical protein